MHEICFLICIHKILVEIHATPVVSLFCASEAKYEIWGNKKGENTNKQNMTRVAVISHVQKFLCYVYMQVVYV